jgi:hypothetical protein
VRVRLIFGLVRERVAAVCLQRGEPVAAGGRGAAASSWTLAVLFVGREACRCSSLAAYGLLPS